MGAVGAQVASMPVSSDDSADEDRADLLGLRLITLRANGAVRAGREIGSDVATVAGADLLPVLPALSELLPLGAFQRGSVVAAGDWSMLCLALAAGPVDAGAWCAAAGIAEFGVSAAAGPALTRPGFCWSLSWGLTGRTSSLPCSTAVTWCCCDRQTGHRRRPGASWKPRSGDTALCC